MKPTLIIKKERAAWSRSFVVRFKAIFWEQEIAAIAVEKCKKEKPF